LNYRALLHRGLASTKEVRELIVRIFRTRTLGLAAEMSFWIVLALVPLAVVAGLVAARLAVTNTRVMSAALGTLPAVARDLLSQEVNRVAAWHGAVAPTALVVFLWLASSGVHSIFDAMEGKTGAARPWWKKRLIALGACVLLSVGVALVALLGTGLDWIWRLAGDRLPVGVRAWESSNLGYVVRLSLGALVAFGLTSGLFVLGVPKPARKMIPLLPGAILAAALEVMLGLGYAFYVSKAGTGGAYLAGLASIGVTMTAIFLISTAMLVGLELNVFLRDRRQALSSGSDSRSTKGSTAGGRW
jgi:membrane protein